MSTPRRPTWLSCFDVRLHIRNALSSSCHHCLQSKILNCQGQGSVSIHISYHSEQWKKMSRADDRATHLDLGMDNMFRTANIQSLKNLQVCNIRWSRLLSHTTPCQAGRLPGKGISCGTWIMVRHVYMHCRVFSRGVVHIWPGQARSHYRDDLTRDHQAIRAAHVMHY